MLREFEWILRKAALFSFLTYINWGVIWMEWMILFYPFQRIHRQDKNWSHVDNLEQTINVCSLPDQPIINSSFARSSLVLNSLEWFQNKSMYLLSILHLLIYLVLVSTNDSVRMYFYLYQWSESRKKGKTQKHVKSTLSELFISCYISAYPGLGHAFL